MKAMKLTGIRQLEMMDTPDPVIKGPYDVKIKMSVVGVCGSDIHYYNYGRIGAQIVKYPFTVGHEGAGIVDEIGSSVKNLKPGDKIAIEPAMPCGECDQCRSGRPNTCRKLKFLGCPDQAEGCLSEYIIMPEKCCYLLNENLTLDHGSISEPLAIGVYAVKKAGNLKGLKIGILGFGPIGMSVMLAAKAQGTSEIFVTEKLDSRLAIALKEGAIYTANTEKEDIVNNILKIDKSGLDIVFECCGQQEALDQSIRILKPGGSIFVIGIPPFSRWSMDVDDTRRKEHTISFIRRQANCVEPSLEMMNNGQIDISNMITHRFPFNKTKEAFELVSGYKDGVMKAMIDFQPV